MSLRTQKLAIIRSTKDFLLASRLLQLLMPFNKLFGFIYNFNLLTSWVHEHKKDKMLMNDFYVGKRDYLRREKSFESIIETYGLKSSEISYLEFGVFDGHSFNWWMSNCENKGSRFFGFDTFEGLPEKWGLFAKGEMQAGVPQLTDRRGKFYKGIFQDTLNGFLNEEAVGLKSKRIIIHMDADLFSSTIFTLSQMYAHLKPGDIIMFDEFNVANHEFQAYKLFTECFYVKMKPISAVNNYYHAAFEVE